MIRTQKDAKTLWHHFGSPLELYEWTKRTPKDATAGDTSTQRTMGESWDLGASHADTVAMITKGWEEGTRQLRDLSRENFAPVAYHDVARSKLTAVQGGGRPVPALVSQGSPLCYQRMQMRPTQQRVIKLWISVGARARVSAQTLMSRGVAALAAIEAYEAKGIRVEVTAATNAHDGSHRMLTTVRIKEAGERLQKQRVAFPIAHPAFFRRMIFGVRERRGDAVARFSDYGVTPGDAPDELPADATWIALNGETPRACYDEICEELTK